LIDGDFSDLVVRGEQEKKRDRASVLRHSAETEDHSDIEAVRRAS
jgi:hypothetical protein